MPIYSMTGFARVQINLHDALTYTLSVKTVNHRFLDVQMRLPNGLDALENDLRKALKDSLVRGHVDLTLNVDRSSQSRAGYNRDLISSYVAAFKAARADFGLQGEPDLNAVLRIPGALQGDTRTDDDLAILSESVLAQIGPLLEELKVMRAREGESLVGILNATMDKLEQATAGVAELRPEVELRYRTRLAERLESAVGPAFDRQRLLEEVAVLVERSDIAEELTRMVTHIGHFRELLKAGGEAGKKLDFLLQEMNREANTLLSKTGGTAGRGTRITELGLAMKSEIEKAREQIQNVE
jgi:uncharacterized protein (TIGR00255 family)